MSVLKLVSCGTCQSLLEIKATIATILIKFDNLSPACNDGKETSVACSEFFFFAYFLLPVVVMVVLSVTMQKSFHMRRMHLKTDYLMENGRRNSIPQVPLQRHMSCGQQSIATIMTLPQLLQTSCLLTTLSCDAEVS